MTSSYPLISMRLYIKSFSVFAKRQSKSIAEYTEEFYKYLSYLNMQETDDQLVARYLSGLKTSIYDGISLGHHGESGRMLSNDLESRKEIE